MVKETLSVARVPSRVGGSFFMDILKMDRSADGLFEQPDRNKRKKHVSFDKNPRM
jgi:hypothetical protein